MCLSLALQRPDDLLAKDEYLGYEWNIMHNGLGFLCGYIKVLPGHPWFGRDRDDINANVHGGITYSEADEPCDGAGADDGWWVGFDCAHARDKPDPKLMSSTSSDYISSFKWPVHPHAVIRDQAYVEAECRHLIEQADAQP